MRIIDEGFDLDWNALLGMDGIFLSFMSPTLVDHLEEDRCDGHASSIQRFTMNLIATMRVSSY